MKKIPDPRLANAVELSAAEMNKIHFGGNHTPLSPKDIKDIAGGNDIVPHESGNPTARPVKK